MDLNDVDFDENMTVPHPSRHPTTTSASVAGLCLDNSNTSGSGHNNHYGANSFASIMGTIDMHQLNHHHHQQQQQQQQHHPHHNNNSHHQHRPQAYLQQQSATSVLTAHSNHHPHHQPQHLHPQQQQQQPLLSNPRHQLPYYSNTSTPAANHYSNILLPQHQHQQQQQQALNLEHQQHYSQLQQQQQIPQHQPQLQNALEYASTTTRAVNNVANNQRDLLKERIHILLQSSNYTQTLLTDGLQIQEELIIDNQERSKLLSKKSHYDANRDKVSSEKIQKDLVIDEQSMRKKTLELKDLRLKFYNELRRIFDQLQTIQNEVLFVHLPQWNQSQQMENNIGLRGESSQVESGKLDQIQEWVEMIFDLTWRIRCQLRALSQYVCKMGSFSMDLLNTLGFSINQSLETLILKTFIVEKQPPQVMKTNTRFTSSVRLLIGARVSLNMTHPVKATIVSEHNARAIIQRHRDIIRASYAPYLSHSAQQRQQPTPMDETVINQPLGAHQAGHNVIAAAPSPTYSTSNGASPPQPDLIQQATTKQQVIQSPPLPTPQNQPIFLQHQQQKFTLGHVPMDSYQQQQQPQQQALDSEMTYGYRRQKMVNINEFDPSGEILNSSNIMEYQEATRHLVCNFRNMQLKKIKRTEKKGTESVMDEKFVLLFHSEFAIQEPLTTSVDGSNYLTMGDTQLHVNWLKYCDLSFHLMAFSLPVVVIVHGNQDPHAWATVTWHNAFARRDDILYQVPDKVYWHELGQVLSDKFLANAGKGLNAQNLEYLASKVCRQRVESSSAIVTWNQFAKEPLPERSFTFWEWFHSILKLTRDHLKELWNADRIFGFMDKKGCIDILLGSPFHEPCQVGTFLLRYSETELGGITIAWVASSAQQQSENHYTARSILSMRRSPTNSTSGNVLMHLLPYVSKDLLTRSLADRINDLEALVYLYPDMPKDEAFSQWYTRDKPPLSQEEYIRPSLKQTLPGNLGQVKANSSNDFNAITPTTPSSYSQSSPDRAFQVDNSTHCWNDS